MIVHIEDSKDDADIVLYSIRKVDGAVPGVRFASGPGALELMRALVAYWLHANESTS